MSTPALKFVPRVDIEALSQHMDVCKWKCDIYWNSFQRVRYINDAIEMLLFMLNKWNCKLS